MPYDEDKAYDEYKDLYIDFPERCDLEYFKRFGKKTLDSAIASLHQKAQSITSALTCDLDRNTETNLEDRLDVIEEHIRRLVSYYNKI